MTRNRSSSSSAVADKPKKGAGAEQEHPLAEAGQDAGQTAGHVAERAADVGFQQADKAREQTAQGLNKLADSVRRVSSDLESEQPMIANVTKTAAEQTERVAGFLRQTDTRELVQNVEDMARRQPLIFVGGAFLLGAVASRFIKAAGGSSGGQSGGYSSGYRSGSAYRATGPGAGETQPMREGLRQ